MRNMIIEKPLSKFNSLYNEVKSKLAMNVKGTYDNYGMYIEKGEKLSSFDIFSIFQYDLHKFSNIISQIKI